MLFYEIVVAELPFIPVHGGKFVTSVKSGYLAGVSGYQSQSKAKVRVQFNDGLGSHNDITETVTWTLVSVPELLGG